MKTNPSPVSKLNYPCSKLRNMNNFSTDLWSILAPEVSQHMMKHHKAFIIIVAETSIVFKSNALHNVK